MRTIRISCDECVMQHSSVCHDCVVTFVCDREEAAVEFDQVEFGALQLLAGAGLVPALRHSPRGA